MGKRYKNLFDQIVEPQNMWKAYHLARLGRNDFNSVLLFTQDVAKNLESLRTRMINGTYNPGEPRRFVVYEPKPRNIVAVPFQDRIVQHAIHNIINPIFEKVFLPQSFACRKGKGTHRAAMKTQSLMRKEENKWYLKTDFKSYFASIHGPTLLKEIKRKVSCEKTINLITKFITPNDTGVAIGNLLSQISANIYGHILDRWLVHTKKFSNFVRYMDDMVIFGDNKEELLELRKSMNEFVTNNLHLNFSRWHIKPIHKGVNFCGYRIFPRFKLLRKNSIIRAKRKLKRLVGEAKDRFLASWSGHITWANTYNLRKRLNIL